MFNELESKDFFSIFYFKKIVGEEEFADFTSALTAYKAHLQSNANQNEDSIVANALKPFFQALGFKADIKHKQKGNSEIDLVLKKDSAVTTIIEAKKPNSAEMFSPSNPHSKALCEAILYYFREREGGGNLGIQSLIITDFYRFYIFKASDFERTFYKNPALKNLYDKFNAPNSLFKGNTEEFYSESKRILEANDFNMGYFCFDLGRIFSENLSFSSLKPIFKALHRDFLFGEFNPNDANILNEKFYRELLYILGLSEVDEKGKILILPSKESQNGANTLYNEILANLPKESADFESAMQFIVLWLNRILFLKLIEANLVRFNNDKNLKFLNLFKVPDFQVMSHLFFKILAKKHNEREIGDSPLSYLPYLNSSLFERHKCEDALDISAIDNNAKLNYFATTQIKDKYGKAKSGSVGLLAYIFEFLDAFDFGADEGSGEIAMQKELISSSVLGLVFEKLNGYKEGSFFTPSFITSYMCRISLEKVVLEKFNAKNPQWQCKTLADIEEEIRREIRLARNAPDSSLQRQNPNQSASTPSLRGRNPNRSISSLRGSGDSHNEAIQKIDCHESANADSRNDGFVSDSRNDSTKRIKDKYIELLETIHICDPAVGSGHFLVSALCEMIGIYHKLGLIDELSEYKLQISNDEIIIHITRDKVFEYKKPTKPNDKNQSIQKSLFHLKKSIIENNLFGVDINPNSVEICKLRLWIELLKNSYYLDSNDGFDKNLSESIHQMQTLPNIDINIKCGNSLVSNFTLDLTFAKAQTKEFAQNLKAIIATYKAQVALYKEALTQKRVIADEIHSLKTLLKNYLIDTKDESKRLRENLRQFVVEYGENHFDIESTFGLEMLRIIRKEQKKNVGFKFQPTMEQLEPKAIDKKAVDLVDKIKADFEILESFKSGNALEWRFEFPEVLDKNGDFMGFDLIIGNPPYIRQEEIKELKPHLQKSFSIYCGTSDIYTYFYERGHSLLKAKGILTLITSNKFCRAGYGANLRAFLLQSAILDFVDLNGVKVFDKATVDTCILNLSKQKPTKSHTLNYANPNAKDLSTLAYSQIPQDSLNSEAFIFVDSPTLALKQKIEKIGTPLKQWDIEINYGIKTGYNEAFIIDTATKDRILDSCESVAEKERTAQIIKPILRGRDIKRYSYEWAGLWLIFLSWHFPNTQNPKSMDENEKDLAQLYPSLYRHLLKHKDNLSKRNKAETGIRYEWYCMQRYGANYYEDFEKEKIVYQQIMAKGANFGFDNQKFFTDTTASIITGANLKYIVALLNSNLVYFVMRNFYMGGGIEGEIKVNNLEKLPIPKINAKNQKIADKIVNLVDKVLQSKSQGKDSTESESQIDDLVYKLYNLDSSEIQIIESN